MRASILLSAPFLAAAAVAQSSNPDAASTALNDNPNTSLLSITGSGGVVTGQWSVVTSQPSVVTTQPGVVTTQPAVATSQPPVASLPALPSGITTIVWGQGTNSTSLLVVSVGNATTSIITPKTPSSSASKQVLTDSAGHTTATPTGSNGASAASGSGTATSTGAAATMQALGGAVMGVGALVAAFL